MSFTVYKSSAGSGKTFTLVKEYLNIVLPEPENFRHILAITFTNKAANEMKERIIDSLMEIARYKDNPNSKAVRFIMHELSERTGISMESIARNADKTLKLVLHYYTDFAVSTIDSFMHRVIRSFAFDLHLPLKFRVEMDQHELLQKAVDILISRIGTDDQLTQILVGFALSKTDDEKNWNIEWDILGIAAYLLKDNGQEFIQNLKSLTFDDFIKINSLIAKFIIDFEVAVKTTAYEAYSLIKSKGIPHDAFFQGNKGISAYFELLANGRFDKIEPNSHVRNTIAGNKWYSGKSTQDERAEIDLIKKELTDKFLRIDEVLSQNSSQYILWREIRKNLYPIALINEISRIMDEYKSENEIVLISEFNKRISDIVMKEPVPFIYERLGEKYRHYLIDEFQDTSLLQWQNLLPLIENSLSTSGFNMVVGDGKQAIYRWRGGEVEQFSSLPKIYRCPKDPVFTVRQEILERNYKLKKLVNNFRSYREIVEFNNEFFKFIASKIPHDYQVIYQDVVQASDPKKSGGLIEFEFYDKQSSQITFEEFNFEKVSGLIKEVIKEGFRYTDIAILCRNNKDASALARDLLLRQIPIISSESLQMGSSPEVRMLVAMMQVIADPSNRIARAVVISYLVKKRKLKGGLHEYFKAPEIKDTENNDHTIQGDFFEFLQNNGFCVDFLTLAQDTIYGLTEELVRIFHLNLNPDPYLQFFLDAVLKFSTEKDENLSDFLDWWADKGFNKSIVIPAGTNAVQVMTIHKAKGLEFPVVIYPFANEKHTKPRNKMWIDMDDKTLPGLKSALVNESDALLQTPYAGKYEEEYNKLLLDMVNILYVVMTRPTHRLYVFTELPAKSKDAADSVPGYFKEFLEMKGLWKDGLTTYKTGEKTFPEREIKKQRILFKLDRFISTRWRDRMILSLHAFRSPLSDEQAKSRNWGTLIHSVLSQTDNAGDIDKVLQCFEADGRINSEEKEEVRSVLNSFISKPEVAGYFKAGLKVSIEPEILLPSGKIYRPDRVVFYENETVIIDFKTGKHEEQQKEQVRLYMDLLKEMGYSNIKGILLYIHEQDPVVMVE